MGARAAFENRSGQLAHASREALGIAGSKLTIDQSLPVRSLPLAPAYSESCMQNKWHYVSQDRSFRGVSATEHWALPTDRLPRVLNDSSFAILSSSVNALSRRKSAKSEQSGIDAHGRPPQSRLWHSSDERSAATAERKTHGAGRRRTSGSWP